MKVIPWIVSILLGGVCIWQQTVISELKEGQEILSKVPEKGVLTEKPPSAPPKNLRERKRGRDIREIREERKSFRENLRIEHIQIERIQIERIEVADDQIGIFFGLIIKEVKRVIDPCM